MTTLETRRSVRRRLDADVDKRRRHQSPREDIVPIELYGLPRGTVTAITVLCAVFAIFVLAPLVWLVINATKTQSEVYQGSGFWFSGPFRLFHNLHTLFENVSGVGVYTRWMLNTVIYALLGGIGATVLSALAGYGFARYSFRGSKSAFYLILATLLVPITAVALPLYLVYAKIHLVNSTWGMVLPSMVAPVGVYLMRTFIDASVPRELIEAARIDGASEIGILFRIALPLVVPGLVTVLLLSVVAIWNNYFLPLMIFSHNDSYPLTVGLASLAHAAETGSKQQLVPVLIAGGLVTIVPLIVLFFFLEKYFRRGAFQGSLTG